MTLALGARVNPTPESWEGERRSLLDKRISELGLSVAGSMVERLQEQLYRELGAKGLAFKPPVYLSDQWGCPDGTPLIGVPFYLADPRLARLEEETAVEVETELEAIRYMRHEAGHAFNYAYRLYDRADWRRTFGPYSRPYQERYRVNPFSRDFVRHILGWYAQKHPDEDFAETFAVWLTPDGDWRRAYAGWPALRKLEYVDRVMGEVGGGVPEIPALTPDDLPVEEMHYTVAEHYQEADEEFPIEDEGHFDGDLRTIFGSPQDAPQGESAGAFIRRHRREVVGRITYWTGESATTVRKLVDFLAERANALGLRVGGLEASTLIELTAFATAVMMNFRYTNAYEATPPRTDAGPP
ncbi:MAG TPA: putative zinc-binding metallopeptidase [Gemmatimonadaceae bacterium]|nr:putative zinc-binding metallopeptidase [Gemmatimonadaceae bacterium]